MELKFHLDESVAHAVARGLLSRGVDVTTSTEANLLGATDQQQFQFAIQTGRVIVSHDQDFLTIVAEQVDHPGLAYCPPAHRSIGQVVLRLMNLWRTNSADQMRGRTVFL